MSLVSIPGIPRAPRVDFTPGADGRTFVLSMRQVADLVGYCGLYEFEDLIVELTGAELGRLESLEGLDLSRQVYRVARYLTRSHRLADSARPARGRELTRAHYDLFLPVFNHPHELFALKAIEGWRERSRYAACYIGEAWEGQLPPYLMELLDPFDHVFVGVKSSVEAVRALCGRPCSYLPMGVDTVRFHPRADGSGRMIDVCGIGRRSPVTHQALLEWALEKPERFYYYDTIQSGQSGFGLGFTKHLTFRVSNAREHRILLGNLLKRSRYFVANRAWADKPRHTMGKEEIAARFYEGAAAGTLMIGDPPDSDDFRKQFDWADAVLPIPFHAPEAARVITELDADAARSARIRRDAVVTSLLRHDWVYRLRTILETAGIPMPEALRAREAKLRTLADEMLRT
jgi:Glycosyl transferases group 1